MNGTLSVSLRDFTGLGGSLDAADEAPSSSVAIASPAVLEAMGRDRRAHLRRGQDELGWIRQARLHFGQGVSLLDLSSGGAQLISSVALGPNSIQALEIVGGGFEAVVPFRVVRCEVSHVSPEGVMYRGGCEFTRPLELPGFVAEAAAASASTALMGIDFELKELVRRAGVEGPGALSAQDAARALASLHRQALQFRADPLAERLAALLELTMTAVDRGEGLLAVIGGIEAHVRRAVPSARLRIIDKPGSAVGGSFHSILVNVPGAPASCVPVSIDLPLGAPLTSRQSRLLRTATRLIALFQRLECIVPAPAAAPSLALSASPIDALPVDASESASETSGWQKVVARYVDGESLKGYSQDFHAARGHFSIRPRHTAPASEAVIVPLTRLKAVFFVRNFAGNPGYVERTDLASTEKGRKIAVTLVDNEVIVGTTLGYRSGGQGFFVTPMDPGSNNIRIFVVSNAVRQVRFP
jgi:hypothetical protein